MVMRAGLPEPLLNEDVVSHSGQWLGCGDLVWLEQRVVGEYQGVEFHSRLAGQAPRRRPASRTSSAVTGCVVEILAPTSSTAARAAKLWELAGHLGVNPHVLDIMAAEPQFLAPAQFARPRRRRS